MVEIPQGSIYFEMYKWGLRHMDLSDIQRACDAAGVAIRKKDEENYWNGWYRSDLYEGRGKEDIFQLTHQARQPSASQEFFSSSYLDYPQHPYSLPMPEISKRWVPCNAANKPMIKWGEGCMSLADAVALKDQVFLAENLKGTRMIVIDCDGNHEEPWDYETMYFLWRWAKDTHCIWKNQFDVHQIPASFHLTFKVDRIIPTMHFPWCHIDIVGNRRNSLRYWKDKEWNHLEPHGMTGKKWAELQEYVKYRKERQDA